MYHGMLIIPLFLQRAVRLLHLPKAKLQQSPWISSGALGSHPDLLQTNISQGWHRTKSLATPRPVHIEMRGCFARLPEPPTLLQTSARLVGQYLLFSNSNWLFLVTVLISRYVQFGYFLFQCLSRWVLGLTALYNLRSTFLFEDRDCICTPKLPAFLCTHWWIYSL